MTGSSPLTRGKPVPVRPVSALKGLIPAHAGKTARSTFSASGEWAHPRSRGENLHDVNEAGGYPGSSPLTRGKPVPAGDRRAARRLIPAHAGKTPPTQPISRRARAHPRSRGENSSTKWTAVRENGSSPLTRGKLLMTGNAVKRIGLIPAHAGKTPVDAAPEP